MFFSQSFKAALKTVSFLAVHKGNNERFSIQQLAKETHENPHTLGKVLQVMVKTGIINSVKGPSGGFCLSEQQADLPVVKIPEAFGEHFKIGRCALGMAKCSASKPCVMHTEYKKARKIIEQFFITSRIGDLAQNHYQPL